jgi:hypothetical protein
LLKFISATSRLLQNHEELWDSPCNIWPSAVPALEEWTKIAMQNTPRPIKSSSRPLWFVCTDASSWGWGYTAFNYVTGEIRTFGRKWNKFVVRRFFDDYNGDDEKTKHSVYAEPLAIYNSLCHLLKSGDQATLEFAKYSDDLSFTGVDTRMKIGIATDNSSAQHTMNRGFASRSYEINKCILKLREAFPSANFDLEFSFVPGQLNPADGPSRGLPFTHSTTRSFRNSRANCPHKISCSHVRTNRPPQSTFSSTSNNNNQLNLINTEDTSAIIGAAASNINDINLRRLAGDFAAQNITGAAVFPAKKQSLLAQQASVSAT